jgi:hypothetical protein
MSLPNLQPEASATQTNSTSANPITVSRVQSAYAASAVASNTLVVTLTVKNNLPPLQLPALNPNATLTDTLQTLANVNYDADPNVLHNVILTDELLPQATLLSASRPSDQNGESHVWNLGDIPPFGSQTVVLTLNVPASVSDFTFLDGGATAWGSWQNQSVTGAAGPITLAPDGYEGWLVCTIDANCNDTYVIEQAAALGNDPLAIFEYVRGLDFNSYLGSLRGARGTLWSEGGNSVDQASLLVALLRASGIPAAYRQGTLDTAEQEQLILSMFPPVGDVSGHISADAIVATPTEDEQILAETSNHWWVEAYLPGSGWTQLDPSFETAVPGDTFAATIDPTRLAEVPDTLRHKVAIRLRVEDYHPLNISGSIPGLEDSYPLDVTFNAVELIGEPVSLGHFVNSSAAGGLIFSTIQHTYVPYLVVGPDDEVIEGNPYQELVTNFPLATTLLTGAWLEFELQMPDGPVETYEREIFDKLGFAARQGGGSAQFAAGSEGNAPAISDQSIYSTLFAPGTVVPEAINASYQEMVSAMTTGQETIAGVEEILDAGEPAAEDLPALQAAQQELAQITRLGQQVHLLNFAAASDLGLERLGNTYLIKPYYDKPRILTVAWEQDVQNDGSVIQFDLRQNEVRAVAYPGQSWRALQAFNFTRGVSDATLEGILLENLGDGAPVISVHHVFEAAGDTDIPLAVITPDSLADLVGLAISDEAKARITHSLLNEGPGKIVVVPTEMVTIDGQETIGWYLMNTINGETIDVMEDGQHTAVIGYVSIMNSSLQEYAFAIIGFFHGFSAYTLSFMGFILEKMPFTEVDIKTAWSQSMEEAKEVTDEIVKILGEFKKGLPDGPAAWVGAYIDGAGFTITVDIIIGEIEITVEGGGFKRGVEFAQNMIGSHVDPPLPEALFSRDSDNLTEPAVVTGVVGGSATLAGGVISADLTTDHLTLSGDMNSQTTLAAANTFEFTSLSSSSATLLDENGAVLGSGSLSAVPLAGSGLATAVSSPVAATTTGVDVSISFHAPAVSGLGSGTVWLDYTTGLGASGTYSVTLSRSVVTVGGSDVFTGTFTLVTADNVTISGAGSTAAPNFAGSSSMQLSGATVNVGPAAGTLDVSGFSADPAAGVALADFTGAITVTEVSTTTDSVSLSGNGDYFTLATVPISSTVLPENPAAFQVALDATYTDSYTVTVSAPAGWDVALSASGQVTVTPPVGTAPDDYPVFVSAQSQAYGVFATAVHTITTRPMQGLGLTVGPSPRVTVGLGRAAGIWNDLDEKLGIPGVTGVYCPPASMGVGMTFVSIEQQYAGHASQVASIAAQCPNGAYFSKFIVVVDEDIDVTDIDQVLWAMSTRANPEDDLDFLTDTWSTSLDPAQNPPEERPYGSKVLVDATKDHQHYDEFAERSALHRETYELVTERWAEYGFDGDPPELN